MENGTGDKNSNRKQKKGGYGNSGTWYVEREIRDGEGELEEEGGIVNREGKLRKREVGSRMTSLLRQSLLGWSRNTSEA